MVAAAAEEEDMEILTPMVDTETPTTAAVEEEDTEVIQAMVADLETRLGKSYNLSSEHTGKLS